MSLADIHLAPMVGYFTMAEEGAALLKQQRKLSRWWSTISSVRPYQATRPQLPSRAQS
jgi:glutathione S-transferase